MFRIPEVRVAYPAEFLFPAVPSGFLAANRALLPQWSIEESGERIYLSFQSFLVRHAGLVILVDSCNGNHKHRPDMPRWHQTEFPWLGRLAEAGIRPQDVDIVVCSHLHADHVGWNTRLEGGRWVPTFPNARYIISEVELAHWQGVHAADPLRLVNHGSYQDSVLPVIEAGLVHAVPANFGLSRDVEENISLEPAAGHTPGHVHLVMRARGQEVIYSADTIHHPMQLIDPRLHLADGDALQAFQTRIALIERCAGTGAMLMPAHFEYPGWIVERKGSIQFIAHMEHKSS